MPADRVIAAQHAWLSPLPPEGASVMTGGIVVAKGNGTALITARAGAASDTTTVTVAQHVARIVFRTQPDSQLAGRALPRAVGGTSPALASARDDQRQAFASCAAFIW